MTCAWEGCTRPAERVELCAEHHDAAMAEFAIIALAEREMDREHPERR